MLLGAGVALLVAVVVLLLVVLTRLAHLDLSRPVLARLEAVEKGQERGERAVREEIAKNRDEMTTQAKYLREEVGASVKGAGDSLVKSVAEISTVQQTQLDAFATQLGKLTETNRTAAKELREEIAACVKALTDSVVASMKETAELQKDQLEIFGQRLQALTQTTEQKLDGIRETVEVRLNTLQDASSGKLDHMRESATESAQRAREEIASSLHGFNESIVKSTGEIAALQKSELEGFSKQLATLMESSEKKHDALRRVVEERLRLLQTDNAVKLDQMRQTVDEKLQGTLEKRLGESFALVSDRLEKVHQGLGEMQTLAMGVGDLKKMLSNVKTRGTWGEVQLGSLLDQVLTPDQFAANVATKDGSGERVEFAIKLPGRNDDGQEVVWLPIDAKCPQEDYHRLLDAREKAHADGVEAAGRDLETAIKTAARNKHSPLNTYVSFSHTPAGQESDSEVTLGDALPGSHVHDPAVCVISTEELQSLVGCLGTTLSSLESSALRLYLEGSSYEDMAESLDCDTKTIDNALQRVKRKVLQHQRARQVLL